MSLIGLLNIFSVYLGFVCACFFSFVLCFCLFLFYFCFGVKDSLFKVPYKWLTVLICMTTKMHSIVNYIQLILRKEYTPPNSVKWYWCILFVNCSSYLILKFLVFLIWIYHVYSFLCLCIQASWVGNYFICSHLIRQDFQNNETTNCFLNVLWFSNVYFLCYVCEVYVRSHTVYTMLIFKRV